MCVHLILFCLPSAGPFGLVLRLINSVGNLIKLFYFFLLTPHDRTSFRSATLCLSGREKENLIFCNGIFVGQVMSHSVVERIRQISLQK